MKILRIGEANVPALGLGTWQLTGSACQAVIEQALELGYRHIDTARMYENETEVGRALERSAVPREEVFVTTKLFLDDLSRERVRAAVVESRERLRTEWIDLLLIHWPHPSIPLSETLGAMQTVQREGIVRHLGVSNFPVSLLEEARRHAPLLCNQVEHHPYLRQDGLLAACRKHRMMLTAYSPLAQGKVLEDDTLRAIGAQHGKSPAQVALRWLMQQDGVAAVPKASSREHLAANLDVFDFELSGEELRAIDRLGRGERLIEPEFAPDWDA